MKRWVNAGATYTLTCSASAFKPHLDLLTLTPKLPVYTPTMWSDRLYIWSVFEGTLLSLARQPVTGLLQYSAVELLKLRFHLHLHLHLTVPPASLTTMGSRAFSRSAPRLWNSLAPELRNTTSPPHFKSKLKTYLFKLSFSLWFHLHCVILTWFCYHCLCYIVFNLCTVTLSVQKGAYKLNVLLLLLLL